ncbi:hypothetical protein HUW51_16060 [Adhaeribacter swui]|uniref:Uncharacterized protein n=1 Tax=Adhaeribacter swui TaxID=2086471 RepID=A0A7G7GAH7_9BACT|nr:hypothetical protein [Adhaeribacter swui]QNF34161.1 hypothetical protein HUW51_16060 [Adhaeribacter swui]
MNDCEPKGELVLLCSNGYFVEKILYSNIQFDQKEILHKSLISLANVQSFDAVLQLVSEIRTNGSTTDWPIQIVLGEHPYNFTFAGTSLHEHVVLTASVEGADLKLIPVASKISKNKFSHLFAPGTLASEDILLMEEINRMKSN